MKKICMIIMVGVLLFSLCAACQPTPEEGVVSQRRAEQYEVVAEPGHNARVLGEVGTEWKESFIAYNGKLSVVFDAQIHLPDHSDWPVYRIVLQNFSQEQVNHYVDVLFHGETQFEKMGKPPSKADYLKQIIEYKALLEEAKENGTVYDMTAEEIEQRIQQSEEQMEKAPLTTEYEAVTPEFEIKEGGRQFVQIAAYNGRDGKAFLWIEERLEKSVRFFYANTDMQWPDRNHCESYGELYSFDHYTVNIKKSADTALEEAEQLLDDLGIEGYSYEGMVKKYGTTDDCVIYKHQAHGVIFTKTYNGVNRLVAPDGDSIVGYTITEEPGGAEFTVAVQNDTLTVIVDDTGIAGIEWMSPAKTVSQETKDVPLMDFEKIKTAITNRIKTRFAYVEDGQTVEVKITDIRLGYATINIKDNFEEFRVVPAWVCYQDGEPIAAVNATDGSIISPG